jgi:outer membrane immunogenic protein
MRKILLGTVGLAAMLASPAMAADMRVAPPPPPVAYYDWSGAYVGFNVGGVWYDHNQHFPTPTAAPGLFLTSADFGTSGSDGIFGFHAGTQWQWGAWVLGVEAALSGCFHECRSVSGLNTSPIFGPQQLAEHKMTNLFTLGPRLGYAWDRWMIFATGGWASANLKSSFCRVNSAAGCDGPGSNGNGASRNNDGWYVGGGFDYMVHKGPLVDVILGVEYQHYDVNGHNAFCGLPGCGAATSADYDLSSKGDLVRARLTIKTAGYGFFWR